jgi:diguanylate cyclase (GGDEF)-like protein/PAS domain S-box-containing protein
MMTIRKERGYSFLKVLNHLKPMTKLYESNYLLTLFVFIATALLMIIYEASKHQLFGDISLWESHAITIVFTSTIAATIAWFLSNRLRKHYHEIQNSLSTLNLRFETSERYLRTIFEAMPDPTLISDEQGVITMANSQTETMLGYKANELVGQSIEMLVPERFRATHPALRTQFAATSAIRPMGIGRSVRALRKDGSELDVEISLSPIRTTQGIFFASSLRDITERRLAETELRIAATTFDSHEAIMITDTDANILRVNRAFEEITGYSAEEVMGKNPRILSSGRHDQDFYAQMWQTLLRSGSWSGEIWDKRKDGQIYPKWLTITAVKDDQGETTQYVAIFSDITKWKQTEEEIHNLAFYDVLTGLPNRRLLLDRLNVAFSVSARNHQYGALLFLDLDKFKTLNDTLGHEYGDLLLVEVAKRLKLCVREVDTVARLGGDEFVVLIENVSAEAEDASQKAAHLAEKIRATLATPYRLKEHAYHSSPSIGVCLYYGKNETVDELLKHADMAMYQAKGSGRNAVRFFDQNMQQAVGTRATLESDLRGAVTAQQLQLYYQIQVDHDQRPIGAEALLRWSHPQRGLVSPAQFIPIAEESSLILEIGHWVLDSACQQIALWSHHEQTRHLVLAVNISAQQFKQPDFVEQVAAMLRKYRIEPSRLKLELTESVVLDDKFSVVVKMLALRHGLGVTLSLDDFGTGYSSLSYLKWFSLDQIKIDQSFVRDMTTDASDMVMVKTIIDMAQNFGLNVIAEGVETEAQLALLKDNGCMAYQGYLFSKPVPIEEFEKLQMSHSSQPHFL